MFGKVSDDSFQTLLDNDSSAFRNTENNFFLFNPHGAISNNKNKNNDTTPDLLRSTSLTSERNVVLDLDFGLTSSSLKLNLDHHDLQQSALSPSSSSVSSSTLTAANSNAASAASKTNTSRYKTELCRPFQEHGTCKYGEKCQFAHGRQELRNVQRHPKYKTDLCRTYHSIGFCPYGPRCHFIHNLDEISGSNGAPQQQQQQQQQSARCNGNSSTSSNSSNSSSSVMPPLPMFSKRPGAAAAPSSLPALSLSDQRWRHTSDSSSGSNCCCGNSNNGNSNGSKMSSSNLAAVAYRNVSSMNNMINRGGSCSNSVSDFEIMSSCSSSSSPSSSSTSSEVGDYSYPLAGGTGHNNMVPTSPTTLGRLPVFSTLSK